MELSDLDSNDSAAIPAALLTAPVYGINLRADTLHGNLAPEGTLLVFLRHFGCMFCREMVADLRAQVVADGERGGIVFFYQGSVPEGRKFFVEHWPSARAIADQTLMFYQGFGVPKASLAQVFSPVVWQSGMKTWARGHRPAITQRNVRQMPGFMWVHDGRIVWRHDFEHVGDHPNLRELPHFSLRASVNS
jgi:hypothetical protein